MKNVFYIIMSILLYVFAPNTYSFPYVIVLSILFLFLSYDLLKQDFRKGNYFTFNSVFLFSFFLTTFALPLFVLGNQSAYDAYSEMATVVFRHVDFNCITQADALCLIAISTYRWGVMISLKRNNKTAEQNNVFNNYYGGINPSIILSALTLSFIISVANIYWTARSSVDMALFTSRSYLFELFIVLLCVYLAVNTCKYKTQFKGIKFFWAYNRIAIIEAIILVLLFFNYGERGIALSIIFIIMGAIVLLYKRLSLKYLLIIAIVGVFVMVAIRLFRKEEKSLSGVGVGNIASATSTALHQNSIIFAFSDLTGISQELCVGYTIKEKYGLQNPEFAFLVPFYAIPFAPTNLSLLFFGKELQDISNQGVLNDYMSKYNSTFGNHCVIDVYMKWGTVGVIVVFFLFGYFVGDIEKRKYSSLLMFCFYLYLISQSLYLPRSSLFGIIRPLAEIWYIMLLFGAYKSSKHKVSNLSIT